MPAAAKLVRVAVPVPLGDGFDYLWNGEGAAPPPGSRVRVPFGRGERIGIVLEHRAESPVSPTKLKPVRAALDPRPVIAPELLRTLRWAAEYYHHPIGEVVKHALPGLLRKGRAPGEPRVRGWQLTAGGRAALAAPCRAARQAEVLDALSSGACVAAAVLKARGVRSDALRRLTRKGWIEPCVLIAAAQAAEPQAPLVALPRLTPEQAAALERLESAAPGFHAFLLHGVTGSGKTEVYLRLIRAEIDRGRQTLMLVPEIGLTPQLVGRLRARFGEELAVIHSALTETERVVAWHKVQSSAAKVVVGTRSAVFAPLSRPGLVIVDEEHDVSYKQQEGFKYSARDLAVVRARSLGIRVLLASATPSLESLRNARADRYHLLEMPKRIGGAGVPTLRVIDLNLHATRHGLSTPLVATMTTHLEQGNQVLLFLNRRGFAPVLYCPQCREAEECDRCDARLTVHARQGVLRCHHCGRERPLRWSCERCGTERVGVGAGTERVSDALQSLYPDRRIARLDRDVTARRGALAAVLGDVERGATDILVGTQMLTKGHDFARVTLVGILSADQGLFGTDLRSNERLAQTIVQVAGRAGRRDRRGEVLIQTRFPEHPLLKSLLADGYAAFATLALEERRLAGWPPFSHLAVFRAEAVDRRPVFDFLMKLRDHAEAQSRGVQILGPAPAAMERRGGRFRAQLLLQSPARGALHALVGGSLAALRDWRESRRVRWSIDVDPAEI